jgi:hypothetical protein
MHRGSKITLLAAVGSALSLFAATAAQGDITTTVSGFGTVGGTFTSNSQYSYTHDSTEFSGASNQFDVGLESRFGLQATFDFGSGLSVTAQEVLRERQSTAFDPGTEWFYVKYAPNADWQVRLGRVVLPAFLYSDSRQVGMPFPGSGRPTKCMVSCLTTMWTVDRFPSRQRSANSSSIWKAAMGMRKAPLTSAPARRKRSTPRT